MLRHDARRKDQIIANARLLLGGSPNRRRGFGAESEQQTLRQGRPLIRLFLDGQPGGMDSYYRIISDRFVGLSIIGSEKEFAKSRPRGT